MKRFLFILFIIGILILLPLYFLEAGSLTSIKLSDYVFRNLECDDLTVNGSLTTSGSASSTSVIATNASTTYFTNATDADFLGTLDVTGQFTAGNSSSTNSTVATALQVLGTLDVTGQATLGNSSSTNSTVSTAFESNGTSTLVANVVLTPSVTLSHASGTSGIVVTNAIMRVQGSGAAVVATSTPTLIDGADGQIVILQGDSDTNTLRLRDADNLANTGLELAGSVDITLGQGDTLHLTYDAGDDKWYELSRSDN